MTELLAILGVIWLTMTGCSLIDLLITWLSRRMTPVKEREWRHTLILAGGLIKGTRRWP